MPLNRYSVPRKRPRIVKTEWLGPDGKPLPDALTHTPRCDSFFEKLSDLPGGDPHPGCPCWCHTNEKRTQ